MQSRLTFVFTLLLGLSLSMPIPNQGRSAPAQSEQNVKAVLRLLTHLQIDNMGDDLFAMMAERTVPTMRSAVPNLPEEAYAILHEELADAFRSASADLMASNAQLYLQHLTPDEIAEMNNFYSTATGKKMLKVIPMLMQQSLYLGQEWVQKMDRDVRRIWRARLKQEGYIKE
ncbi:MAG: DUF2059 domain-containing protein [Rhodospirillaceae bacterium]|nr:DUF2059 domain-containing protein [Rhodospirillaceae bacterium]